MGAAPRAVDRRLPPRRARRQGLRAVAGVATSAATWWRVGHVDDPVGYVPRDLCSWQSRFDDVRREYRTVYGARSPLTCLREVLADLRPDAKARADFAQFQIAQGIAPADLVQPSRDVTVGWRASHVLARARVVHDGDLVDLDDVVVREELERRFADLLAANGMAHLDISAVRSKARVVTQTISRALYDEGAAGILFRSNLDDERCVALMEGRAAFRREAEPVGLLDDVAELQQVCLEYGLTLREPLTVIRRR